MKQSFQLLAGLMLTLLITGGLHAADQSVDRFLDVQQIVILKKGADKQNQIVVSEPNRIKQLVAALHLVKSDERICDMQWGMTFIKKAGKVEAAVCKHCFEIRDGIKIDRFETPPEFYKLVQQIETESGQTGH